MSEFCYRCQKVTESVCETHPTYTEWLCAVCGWQVDCSYYDDYDDEDRCPWCGGDCDAEYLDCPEAWGEDCPSEVNHLITCPKCKGSGLRKDCDVQ